MPSSIVRLFGSPRARTGPLPAKAKTAPQTTVATSGEVGHDDPRVGVGQPLESQHHDRGADRAQDPGADREPRFVEVRLRDHDDADDADQDRDPDFRRRALLERHPREERDPQRVALDQRRGLGEVEMGEGVVRADACSGCPRGSASRGWASRGARTASASPLRGRRRRGASARRGPGPGTASRTCPRGACSGRPSSRSSRRSRASRGTTSFGRA